MYIFGHRLCTLCWQQRVHATLVVDRLGTPYHRMNGRETLSFFKRHLTVNNKTVLEQWEVIGKVS